MNLNGKQIISIVGAVLGVLMISTSQLTDLFGVGMAKNIVSIAALGSTILNSVMVALTTQSAQVKDVLAMPGVEKMTVNSQASPALATIAIDPKADKIAPTQAALVDVTKTAQGIAP